MRLHDRREEPQHLLKADMLADLEVAIAHNPICYRQKTNQDDFYSLSCGLKGFPVATH